MSEGDRMDLMAHETTCPTCTGTGWEAASDMGQATTEPCATCAGDGKVVPSTTYRGAVDVIRKIARRGNAPANAHANWIAARDFVQVLDYPTTGGQ
jgi:DnaJ-class molecular chaperone